MDEVSRVSMGTFSFAFRRSLNAFRQHTGLMLASFLIFCFALATPLQPFLGPPLLGGLCTLYLAVMRGGDARLADVLAGFNAFWKWTAVGWLLVAIYILCLMPFLGLAAVNLETYNNAIANGYPASQFALKVRHVLIMGLGLMATCAIMPRWAFAPFLVADGYGALRAVTRSSVMSQGHRLRLFKVFLGIAVVAHSGVIVLFFGVFLTMAFAFGMVTSVYLDLLEHSPADSANSFRETSGSGGGEP